MLYPKIVDITKQVADGGPPVFSATVERLKTQPSPEAPGPGQTKYDEMLHELMISIWEECKKEGVDAKNEKLGEILVKKLESHQQQLQNRQKFLREDVEKEKEEQRKKITSDDIHEGFSSSVRVCLRRRSLQCTNQHNPSPLIRPQNPRQLLPRFQSRPSRRQRPRPPRSRH